MEQTRYFTFGQNHVHSHNRVTLDKDVVLRITGDCPRNIMFELFGDKWCFEYDKKPEMSYFSKGVFDINKNQFDNR